MKEKRKLPFIAKFAIALVILFAVLQILGIILGVVSASVLMKSSTSYAVNRTAYKKYVSIINQAILLGYTKSDDRSAKGLYKALKDGGSQKYKPVKICQGQCTDAEHRWVATAGNQKIYFGGTNGYTFFYEDGAALMLPKTSFSNISCLKQTKATKQCVGALDINGKEGPNEIVTCDDGTTNSESCKVSKPSDVYPIAIYNDGIHPASKASSAVLFYSPY